METLVSKSAGKQMEWSKNGCKPTKIVQKMFADLFVYSDADFEGAACFFLPIVVNYFRKEGCKCLICLSWKNAAERLNTEYKRDTNV